MVSAFLVNDYPYVVLADAQGNNIVSVGKNFLFRNCANDSNVCHNGHNQIEAGNDY